jgi:tRNA-dihydrouridine synthase
VKNNPRMHIPIIGNGDINSPQKAKEAFDRYGVDGIMVARASFGHPWIFKEIKHYLNTGELLPPMSVPERVALAKRHLDISLQLKGPVRGCFGNEATPLMLFQRLARLQRHQNQTGDNQRSSRTASHIGFRRGRNGEISQLPKHRASMDCRKSCCR